MLQHPIIFEYIQSLGKDHRQPIYRAGDREQRIQGLYPFGYIQFFLCLSVPIHIDIIVFLFCTLYLSSNLGYPPHIEYYLLEERYQSLERTPGGTFDCFIHMFYSRPFLINALFSPSWYATTQNTVKRTKLTRLTLETILKLANCISSSSGPN